MENLKQNLPMGVFVLVAFLGIWFLYNNSSSEDYKNITYNLDGKNVTLVSRTTNTGAALALLTTPQIKYIGGDLRKDFNNDGLEDVAFFSTQTKDGIESNIFYYMAVALNTVNGYQGTNMILLGNHITEQKIKFNEGELIVSYLTRAFGETNNEKPSVNITKYFKLVDLNWVESRLPDIGEFNVYNNLILVVSPTPETIVQNPLTVTGVAKDSWYFENSFPVMLLDGNGNIISAALAKTEIDSKTTNFTTFKATLNFVKPNTKTGILIFKKNNPSGLSENDNAISVPVKFY